MKKTLVLFSAFLLLCGCQDVNHANYDELVDGVIASKYDIINTYRTGYKFYTPTNMSVLNSLDYNEILEDANFRYYFYVDVVSYHNRVIENYVEDKNALYSKTIKYEDKYGYIEINKWNNGAYLLEIMYNYAKIEVIVDEVGLRDAIANSIIILSSVKYNNNVLDNIVGENVLTAKEIEFNIFETKKTESNFLQVSENDIYKETEDINDPDLVN